MDNNEHEDSLEHDKNQSSQDHNEISDIDLKQRAESGCHGKKAQDDYKKNSCNDSMVQKRLTLESLIAMNDSELDVSPFSTPTSSDDEESDDWKTISETSDNNDE